MTDENKNNTVTGANVNTVENTGIMPSTVPVSTESTPTESQPSEVSSESTPTEEVKPEQKASVTFVGKITGTFEKFGDTIGKILKDNFPSLNVQSVLLRDGNNRAVALSRKLTSDLTVQVFEKTKHG